MKNTFTLSVLMGAAGLAHAQQTVSLSGTADAYVQSVRGSLTKQSLMNSGGNSTSKLTLRGEEDLGSGLRVGFWLESGLSLNTGTGNATNTTNVPAATPTTPSGATPAAGLTWNRRAIVYLRGALGELQLGRNWSPTYDTFTSRFDVMGVGSGIGLNYTASINPNQVRVSNGIAYLTPAFGGFRGNVQHWRGALTGEGKGNGARLHFDQGKFGAILHYARTDFVAGDAIYKGGAVIYDFGPAIVSANYTMTEQGTLEQKGGLLGVRVPVGSHELKGSYSWHETNAAGSPKGAKIAIGGVYNLSKRTALYTSFASIDNSNGSQLAIAGSTTAPNKSSSGFDLGLRHNF